MKFCFLCGKKTNKLIEGYCEECYVKEFQLIEVPDKIVFIRCGKCGFIEDKKAWKDIDVEDLIKKKIKILGNKVNIKVEMNDKVKIFAKGFLRNSKKIKEQTHEIVLKENKITCPICCKRLGNYFEGEIQLRGDVTKEILDFIDDQMASEFLKDRRAFYKIEKIKNGFDLSMSDSHITNKIVEILRRKFRTEIKKTYRILNTKNGKKVYKITALVKIY